MRLPLISMLLLMTTSAVAEQSIEHVTVCSVDRYRRSAYPSIERLADGQLLCVFSANNNKTEGKMVVVGTFSRDHGRMWSEPVEIIDSKGENDYDPSIVVIGSRVLVSSTIDLMYASVLANR